ncbi:ATP-grasp domain [uncultured virus]|nr:ATP-grasp domain [uncultured virus]
MKFLIDRSCVTYTDEITGVSLVGDADDIVAYCKDHNYECRILPGIEIAELSPDEFFEYIPFCDTRTFQSQLTKIRLDYLIPDTYSPEFQKFYRRNICKTTSTELANIAYPYFIKSACNNKMIDGMVVRNDEDLKDLWIFNQVKPDDNLSVYVCEVVSFVSEYRLLIGNNVLYGCGFQMGNDKQQIPSSFINEIVSSTKGNFLCIDVGCISERNQWTNTQTEPGCVIKADPKQNLFWAIVEVNPPFSIDDFGIPLDDYIQYAIDFMNHVKVQRSRQN